MTTLTHDILPQTDDSDQPVEEAETLELVGVLAEYRDVTAIMKAARGVRNAGFTRWDVYSPFPIHGIDAAIGIRPTILPWIVLCGGLTGTATAYGLQWFCNAFDYKFMISGKPYISLPAFIPVMFELTVLFSALTTVAGMLLLNRLPMHYNPLFKSDRFRRVTNDRFFIAIDASDPKFEEQQTTELLQSLGSIAVERVED